MSKNFTRLMRNCLVFIIILTMTSVYSFAYVMGNFGDNSFQTPDGRSTPLNIYIVNGAGYFLNAYADTLLFLGRIEISDTNGIDYNELGIMVKSAIENMEKAKQFYTGLKQAADLTPYNPAVIEKLLSFDYRRFQRDNGSNITVLKRVEYYLGEGDVRGFYGEFMSVTGRILNRLYAVKAEIDSAKFPGLENLWRLNQEFAEAVLFGQYGSEVFKTIL